MPEGRTGRTESGGDDDAAVLVDCVRFGWGGGTVLDGVSLRIHPHERVALVGRNGCGKSTLLRLMAGLLVPTHGSVRLFGDEVSMLSRREIARRCAVLHQSMPTVPGLTVAQLVRQGRFAHRSAWSMLSTELDEVAQAALERAGVTALQDRETDSLSGGERQRVRLALALAQDAPLLLLDEPTTFLDVRHQWEVLDLVDRLAAGTGVALGPTVVMVLHDLDHAARFADRVIALADGRIVADGSPAETITPAMIAEVFGVRARVQPDALTGLPRTLLDGPT